MLRRLLRELERNKGFVITALVVLFLVFWVIRNPAQEKVADPVFVPAPEDNKLYEQTNFEIKTDTEGATIHYEIVEYGARKPELNVLSEEYTNPLTAEMNSHITVYAFVVKSNMEDSNVVSQTYEVKNKASTPDVNVETVSDLDKRVTLSKDIFSDIYYTLDGSCPIENGRKYNRALTINSIDYPDKEEITLKAVTRRSDYFDSDVIEKTIEIPKKRVEQPGFRPANDTFTENIEVSLSTNTRQADIYYKIVGYNSSPPESDELTQRYREPIRVNTNSHVRIYAQARREGMEDSRMVSKTYEVRDVLDEPNIFTRITTDNKLNIRMDSFSGNINYSLDGSSPYYANRYTEAFELDPVPYGTSEDERTLTLKAVAHHPNYFDSDIVEKQIILPEEDKKEIVQIIEQKKHSLNNPVRFKDSIILDHKHDQKLLLANTRSDLEVFMLDDNEINWNSSIENMTGNSFVLDEQNQVLFVLATKIINNEFKMFLIELDKNDGSVINKNKLDIANTKGIIIKNHNDNFVIGGIENYDTESQNFSVSVINKKGDILWTEVIVRPDSLERLYDIEITEQKNILAVGDSTENIWADILFVMYDDEGNKVFEKSRRRQNDNSIYNAHYFEKNDAFLLVGETNSDYPETPDDCRGYNILIKEIDHQGNTLNRSIIGGRNDFYPVNSFLIDEDKLIIAGNKQSHNDSKSFYYNYDLASGFVIGEETFDNLVLDFDKKDDIYYLWRRDGFAETLNYIKFYEDEQ